MSTTEKPPEVAAPKKATPTEYVVLEQTELGQWVEQKERVTAAGSTAALKKHLDAGRGTKASALVAVPARSWQPVKPKTETVTKTTLEAL